MYLQHSYGFIQGSDREIRLFFHFSEFKGDKDTMNIGGMSSLLKGLLKV